MEFKCVENKINDLITNKDYLTDLGKRTLFEFEELLRQRKKMLEMLKNVLDNISEDYYNLKKDIEQLIEEATKID